MLETKHSPKNKEHKIIFLSDTHGRNPNLAKTYTAISKEIQADKKRNLNITHIFVLGGDVFGSNKLLSAHSSGDSDIEIMAAIANLFDKDKRILLPGNHDFNFGTSQLAQLAKQGSFRIIASNVEFEEKSSITAETNITINGLKMLGLMTPETKNNKFGAEAIKTMKVPTTLEETDVVLSHLGFNDDRRKLPKTPCIIGGHSHYSKNITLTDGRRIVNAGSDGEFASVTFINRKATQAHVRSYKSHKPAPEITRIIEKHEKTLNKKLNLKLGEIICEFDEKSRKPSGLELYDEEIESTESHLRATDSILTRVTADAIAKEYKAIGLFPAGAIRINFAPGQKITRRDIYETYIFNNKLITLEVSGEEVITALAKGVLSNQKNWHGRGKLLHPSAELSYHYDVDQKPGDVIRSVNLSGQPINLQKKYTIVTTDWIVNSGFFPNGKNLKKPSKQTASIVTPYLKGKILREKFSTRITCKQNLQAQEKLTEKFERSYPKPDVSKIKFNIEHHQKRYDEANKQTAKLKSPGKLGILPTPTPEAKISAEVKNPPPPFFRLHTASA